MNASGSSLSVLGRSPNRPPAVDTRPLTAAGGGGERRGQQGVLSKGSPAAPSPAARAKARHDRQISAEGHNPWEVVLSPRKTKADAHVTQGQSPTTAARARRVRREKALAKIAAEEEMAAKKGGIAYARRMRQEKAEKARAKAKADRISRKMSKVKGHGPSARKKMTDTSSKSNQSNDGKTSTSKKKKNSSVDSTGSSSSDIGKTSRASKSLAKHSKSRLVSRSSSSRVASRNASRNSRLGKKSSGTSATSTNRSSSASDGAAMPTRAKMRQLKQEADTQESIRALIDKVTIDFERMPASDESISRRRRTTREGMLRGSAKLDQNDSTIGEGSCEPVAPSTAVSLEAPPPTMLGLHRPDESVDLESARVDIQIGDQAVGREEEELARRAAALQEDMDRLKQRKLKLHLAKYEHDLRLQAKERLAALETRSYQQMETKIKALADHTKRQLNALDEFDRDLRKKIQRLLSLQTQTEEKRSSLNDTFESSQVALRAAHTEEVHRMKEQLEKQIQGRLNDAAKAEGWKIQQETSMRSDSK